MTVHKNCTPIKYFVLVALGLSLQISHAQKDLDQDGMDDSWELNYGLDPNDRKDAWLDEDGDQVLNLFEFQLGTNPLDLNSPQVVYFSEGESNERFQDLVGSGYDGLVVIRISEGDYHLGFNQGYHFNGNYYANEPRDKSYRVMLQGGWNRDFSEYNPFCYETNVEMDRELLRMGTLVGDTSVAIIEGLRVSGYPKSLGGTVRYMLNVFDYNSWSRYSIYNTSITHSSGGIHLRLDLDAGPSEVYIVNSNISNNGENVHIELPNPKTPSKIHIINSVVTFAKEESKGLMEIYYNTVDTVDFIIENSIVWDEGKEYSTNVFPNKTIDLEVVHSDFKGDNAFAYSFYNNVGGFNLHPEFVDTTKAFYQLPDDSPMKDQGVDVGLAYRGLAPDLGVNPYLMRVNDVEVEHLKCQDQFGSILLDIYYPGPIEFSLNNNVFQDEPTFSDLEPGSYQIQVRSKSGCESMEIPIEIFPAEVAFQNSISSRYNECTSTLGTIEIHSISNSTDLTYSLDGRSFQQSPVFEGLDPDTYKFTIRDINGCDYKVTYELAPNVQIGFDKIDLQHTSCGNDNGEIELSINGSLGTESFSLNNGVFSSNDQYGQLSQGDYVVTVKDERGCQADTIVHIKASDPVAIDSVQIVHTTCGLNNASMTIKSSSQTVDPMYSISDDMGQQQPFFADISPGTYTAVMSDKGCLDSIEVIVESSVPIQLELESVVHTSCNEDNGALQLRSIGTENVIFELKGSSNSTGHFYDLTPGRYLINLIDVQQCRDSLAVDILSSKGTNLSIDQINDASCQDDFGDIFVIGQGNGEIMYSLNGGQYESSSSFLDVLPDTYRIKSIDAEGCQDSVVAVVRKINAPVIDSVIVSDDNCSKGAGKIEVMASDGVGHLVYSLDSVDFQNQFIFNELTHGEYSIYVKDESNCVTNSKLDIPGSPSLEIENLIVQDISCNDSIGQIEYDLIGGTGLIISSLMDQQQRLVREDELAVGNYLINVIDEVGCSDKREIVISLKDCDVYVPNIFSKNGQGDNEKFKISMSPMDRSVIVSFVVMDRWGGEMYHISNQPIHTFQDWWDGTIHGEPVASGVYFYDLMIRHLNGSEEIHSGTITVIN